MSILTYNIVVGILSIAVLFGLSLMSNVKSAVLGNVTCSTAMGLAIIATIVKDGALASYVVWISLIMGTIIGLYLSNKVKMIQMPQLVALLNGLGGGSAAIVGFLVLIDNDASALTLFVRSSASVALVTGMMTIAGALVAAGKLHHVLPQKPIILANHSLLINILIALMVLSALAMSFLPNYWPFISLIVMTLSGALFGCIFAIRVGGADMPITISLLNSLAGISAAIAGFSIYDPMLVSIGAIVGATGLLLTRIMCKAMNRKLYHILLGATARPTQKIEMVPKTQPVETLRDVVNPLQQQLQQARNVIMVPGYGMALAQAQHKVKELTDLFEANGAEVKFAVHPVAGRMPGHMNVLLAEAGINYEQLIEMDEANPLFSAADLVVVVGANDVINPAAMEAEGTPIYGMPILRVDEAKNIVICNFDTKPGYAGVDNPLYQRSDITLLLGDAALTVSSLVEQINSEPKTDESAPPAINPLQKQLHQARNVIMVPGYGMALAQAQHKVKELTDLFEANGAEVKFAVHPVAGRMPGHMNVLLAEAGINYEQLIEMDEANPLFSAADLVVVVGANDVINPAAMEAEGTPIYGMPILRVDEAKNIVICNFDTKPGYAGVDNPLYQRSDITLLLGDAALTVSSLVEQINSEPKNDESAPPAINPLQKQLHQARNVIMVPGYGMALAQAQHKVKELTDLFEANGAEVKFAVHPVAGRMPGHMNVLLAEAGINYEQLIEMDEANPLFAKADLVVVVGANDVINPAAMEAEGTPIYGMPILRVDEAKNIVICNFDTKPGYAGVDNPLYQRSDITLLLGDAAGKVQSLINMAP